MSHIPRSSVTLCSPLPSTTASDVSYRLHLALLPLIQATHRPCPSPPVYVTRPPPFPLNTLHTLGKVAAGSSQTIVFTVRPATPSSIAETFFIKMAHFEKVPVQCYCNCIFSAVVANLPRQKKMG